MSRASLFCAPLVAVLFAAPAWAQIAPTAFVDDQLDVPVSVLEQLGELLPSAPNADSPWPGIPAGEGWRRLDSGTALGEVEGLFTRIDEDAIRAEVEALEARAAAAEG